MQHLLDGLLAHDVLIGQPHAVGAQHARQGVNQHAVHAQGIGDQAGVLPPCATKALQGVARHVVAPRDRDFFDGVRHLLHRNRNKAFRDGVRAVARLGGERFKLRLHHVQRQRFVGLWAEYRGEAAGLQLAEQDVGIGDGQRAAASVTGWPRVCACTLGADAKARAIKAQQ